MAIKGFKEVVDKKGYRIDSKDREIFERELKESLFGTSATNWDIFGNTDLIEFVLYDTNDNQLPQGDSGQLVRYISMDDENIRKYFVISENINDIKANGAKEFLVDTAVLIREAGYSNGIFKTQITLINRRAGSERRLFDRMWIHEISPSRTEIRILPVNEDKGGVLPDLQERYNVYLNNGEFRDDTISFVQQYVENIDLNKVFEQMLKIKGVVVEGQTYIDLIKEEFKIHDFGKFLFEIKRVFVKSMQYWVENRDSNLYSLLYGKPLSSIPPVELSVTTIKEKSFQTLIETIDFLLLKRDILENATLSFEEQITFDEIKDILETTTDDSIYDTTLPDNMTSAISGCMDIDAKNFNPDATYDDGSCIFVVDDIPVKTEFWYVWSEKGKVSYLDVNGIQRIEYGVHREIFEITYQEGSLESKGDVRNYPQPRNEDELDGNTNNGKICLDVKAMNYGQVGVCVYNTPAHDGDNPDGSNSGWDGYSEDGEPLTPVVNDNGITIYPDYIAPDGDIDINTIIRIGRTP